MKILFVSHAANRSGAPLVLLELLRFLKREGSHTLQILSARPGPLDKEFALWATPFARPALFRRATLLAGAARRVDELGLPVARKKQLAALLRGIERLNLRGAKRVAHTFEDVDLIYANSAASGDAVRALSPLLERGAKLVVHVHELAWALEQNRAGWDFLRARGDFFIAASDAVRDELIQGQNIAPQKTATVYEWTNLSLLETDRESARRDLRSQIGVAPNAVLVGGCGTIETRKGADLWIQAAFYALKTETSGAKAPAPLHFVWLGGGRSPLRGQIERDVRSLDIENRVYFLPPSDEPKRFFAGLDVFCLSSREDPFPLVAVEAAAQGVPVVCFAGAGGAPELVKSDAGVVVPWGDVASMGRALSSLGRDADFRKQLGGNARSRAREMCDVERNGARVEQILRSVVSV